LFEIPIMRQLSQLLRQALLIGLITVCLWLNGSHSAIAAVDPYVTQYLQVFRDRPATLTMDKAGTTKVFNYDEILAGKELFGQNCLSCHVGGTTLSSPSVSLTLENLKGATPPRDTVNALMAYMRHPLAYDGSEENYSCREVSADWLNDDQVEKVGAFLLRAAEYAKGWGTAKF
jgi:photosystem II cytochrome c550